MPMAQTPNSLSVAGLHLDQSGGSDLDLDTILHPGRVFAHPSQVVEQAGLSLQEKRAILASWASDACALDSAPGLRSGPSGGKPVSFDEVMDALRMLDGISREEPPGSREAPGRRRRTPLPFGRARICRRFGGSGSEQEPGSGPISLN
jgi:hypothetical protein